jgi:hypothetical protein
MAPKYFTITDVGGADILLELGGVRLLLKVHFSTEEDYVETHN